MKALARQWEARLAREGLASLDCPGGMVSNAGAGKVKSDEAAARRDDMAAELERRRARLRQGFSNRADRRIWKLYADGVGYQTIARKLRLTDYQARNAIARLGEVREITKVTKSNLRIMVRRSDSEILLKLTRVLCGLL